MFDETHVRKSKLMFRPFMKVKTNYAYVLIVNAIVGSFEFEIQPNETPILIF